MSTNKFDLNCWQWEIFTCHVPANSKCPWHDKNVGQLFL